MLTDYERIQLERAVSCIRAGCSPKNMEELAEILEHCLAADHRAAERDKVYKAPASRGLRKAMDSYGLGADDGATVGELLAAVVRVESSFQKKMKARGLWKKTDRTGG